MSDLEYLMKTVEGGSLLADCDCGECRALRELFAAVRTQSSEHKIMLEVLEEYADKGFTGIDNALARVSGRQT